MADRLAGADDAPLTKGYHVVQLSPERRLTADLLQVAHSKHVVHGLIDVDVTLPRRLIDEHRTRTGETLSFTGLVISCVARAVAENGTLNSVRRGRRLVVFDEVDVNTMVERRVRGELVVAPYIVRSAQRKTFRQIHDEIRAAQAQPLANAGGLVGGGWVYAIPSPARRLFMRTAMRSARLAAKFGGIVGVTAIGMFGDGAGWGIPLVPTTLMVTVGGIGKRPALESGRLVEREYLCLTLTFDHDLVDGAPAARFAARLRELLTGAAGLDVQEPVSEGVTPQGHAQTTITRSDS
jgi:pyruvate/2-oxoglutarate dehydrogenase complex dihydrolipoamide acyltransferase (E2) component